MMVLEVPVSASGLKVNDDPFLGLNCTFGTLGMDLSSCNMGVFTIAQMDA